MSDEALARFGAELRRIREDAGLSGSEVTRQIGWSQSKLSRLETGRFGASVAELAALLDFYVVPEEVRAELLSRVARREGLEGAWVVRAGGPRRRQTEVGTIESRVSRLRQHQAATVPGLLQTRNYARAIARAGGFSAPDAIASRRLVRQDAFHERADVAYEVVLDARVLMRWPGDNDVMAEQLDYLASLDRSIVDLRVLPPGAGAGTVAMASFVLYEFAEQPAVVLVETQAADLYLSARDDIVTFSGVFEGLTADALSVDESSRYLRDALRDLRSA